MARQCDPFSRSWLWPEYETCSQAVCDCGGPWRSPQVFPTGRISNAPFS